MVLHTTFLPLVGVDGGEKGVGIWKFGIHSCEVDGAHHVDGGGVDLCATYNHHLAGHFRRVDGVGYAMGDGHIFGVIVGIAGDHNVLAAGERAFRKRFKRGAPHHYAMPHGDGFEMLHVG